MRRVLLGLCVLGLSACTTTGGGMGGGEPQRESAQRYFPFSASSAGQAVPDGWQTWLFGPLKPPTEYRTETDPATGQVVVHAHAVRAASALLLPIDPLAPQPRFVAWRWRAGGLIAGADVSQAVTEDSPVRLLLGFEGDHSKLSFREQMFAERVKLMSGLDMPYAILMYVWANHQAPETIVPNPHTGRIQMLVVEQGEAHVGAWERYGRDITADFRRAFGEDPGPLVMVGVMTDTDNTGGIVDADYGDVELFRTRPGDLPPDNGTGRSRSKDTGDGPH